jgi:hypothetical protein
MVQTKTNKDVQLSPKTVLFAAIVFAVAGMTNQAQAMSQESRKLFNEAKERAEEELRTLQTAHQSEFRVFRRRVAKMEIGDMESEGETEVTVTALEPAQTRK